MSSGIEESAHGPQTETAEVVPSAPLRATLQRIAEIVDGGAAAFLRDGAGESLELCAAAGTTSPEVAQHVGFELRPSLERVFATGEASSVSLRDGQGTTRLLPLVSCDRSYGVLVLSLPHEPSLPLFGVLELAADHLAAQLSQTELAVQRPPGDRAENGDSDQVLQLSEELFAQKIQLLRNDEQLGQIERMKNDFIEKMSRELRTPLNSIIEVIIAVLAGEHEALSSTARQTLRGALDEGTAFLRTLQNILDLWRIKQGELPVEIHDVDFHKVVEEAIFSVQDAVEGKALRIEKVLQESLPKIRSDVTKLNQLLFLLLDNAVKFTQEGRIEIRARLEGEQLVFALADTGVGICTDDQQLVFDEFFQVDHSASTKYRGAGLGLALVRGLVGLLGGSVTLVSEVGKGSTFSVRLPVQIPDS